VNESEVSSRLHVQHGQTNIFLRFLFSLASGVFPAMVPLRRAASRFAAPADRLLFLASGVFPNRLLSLASGVFPNRLLFLASGVFPNRLLSLASGVEARKWLKRSSCCPTNCQMSTI